MENNVPTWYASITLFLCSSLLSIIAIEKRAESDSYWLHWVILSFIFICISIDEMASLHNLFGKVLNLNTEGIFFFSWVVIGIPLVIILMLVYYRFLFHLPHNILRLFLLSGSLFVGGALGMELFDGWYASRHGTENITYWLLTSIEETLEMTGIAVFIYSLLAYILS